MRIRVCTHGLVRVFRRARAYTHADVHALEALKSRRHPAVLADGEDNKERKTVVDCCLQGGCKMDVRGIKRPREGMRKRGRSECSRESAYNIELEEGAKRGRGGDGDGGGGGGGGGCGGGVSVKKVDEQRWDRGRKKRRGRELCVLRSAHAFRETQDSTCPPSSRRTATRKSAGLVVAFAVLTSPLVLCEKSSRDVNPPRVNTSPGE